MYLTGALIMILSALTVVGTLASDVLLAVVDPRIRYQ
jgi:peptide/nickel transport system permease protein